MKARSLFLTAVVTAMVIGFTRPTPAWAQIPQKMNYQGYLTDSGGTPVNNNLNLTFYIYDVSSGGSALWTETQTGVTVTNGIYNVVLGSTNPISLPFRKAYYLSMQVQGEASEMLPRHLLTNAAYAMASRKVVYQQVLTVAKDGGDEGTVSAAIDMLLGLGAYAGQGALSPAPSISTPWVIEVQAGLYTEPGTTGGGGAVVLPDWVTVRGQGWNATQLTVSGIVMSSAASTKQGTALESLMVICTGGNPVVNMQNGAYCYVRECKIEATSCNIVLWMGGAQHSDVVDTSIFTYGGNATTGVLVQQTIDVRVENCVLDITNSASAGSAGITDNNMPAQQLSLLENTVLYNSAGGAPGSYGIGLTAAGGMGRVSHNTFFRGVANKDVIDLVTRVTPVNPFAYDGICNQDSTGNQMAAF